MDQDKQIIAIGLKWGLLLLLFCVGMFYLCRATDSDQPYSDPWYVQNSLFVLVISMTAISGLAIRDLSKKIPYPSLAYIYGVGMLLFMIVGIGRFLYPLLMGIKVSSIADRTFLEMNMGYIILAVISFLLAVVLCSWWKIFKKFDLAGWYAIIPIVNLYFLYKIVDKEGLFFASVVIPVILPFTYFNVLSRLRKRFEQELGVEIMLLILPFIYYPKMAFTPQQPITAEQAELLATN